MKSAACRSVLVALSFAALVPSPASATLARAWMASSGSDTPACGPVSAPCRTLQYVVTNIIAANGEIDVSSPSGYGAAVIDKPLSIVNDGVGTAGIVQTTLGADAIVINAPGGAVLLRGLNIEGLGTAGIGVRVTAAASVTIDKCTIRRFQNFGVNISVPAGTTKLIVTETSVTDNGQNGLSLGAFNSGQMTALISRVTTTGNGASGVVIGVSGTGGALARATIVDSISADNAQQGFAAVGLGASVRIGRSVATRNDVGVSLNGGATAQSYGDNKIDGNFSSDAPGPGSFPIIPMR